MYFFMFFPFLESIFMYLARETSYSIFKGLIEDFILSFFKFFYQIEISFVSRFIITRSQQNMYET